VPALVAMLALAVVGAWYVTRRPAATPPPALPQAALSGWTLVTSDGTDPWVVAAKPPEALTSSLFKEASRRSGRALIAPPQLVVPLVLRAEFEDGLQGVYGTDSVLRIAREAGVETATFRPVCLAHRTANDSGSGRAELYFVPFESQAFNQMRVDLLPAQPEHAGVGVYEPATVTPVLVVGATDASFERWWPMRFDPASDCAADLPVSSNQN
jgi:hypothetical protein